MPYFLACVQLIIRQQPCLLAVVKVIVACLCTTNVFRVRVRPVPIVLVKCWNVAHWNAKKLLKNCQKSKKLLPKFQKLLPKFLAIFI